MTLDNRVLLVATFLGAVIGCDGSTTSPDAGPSAAEACTAEATALCELRSTCSGMFDIAKNFPDQPTCVTRFTATCVSALAATGTGQTPVHVEACATAYPAELCPDLRDNNPVTACVPPMGARPIGAACGAAAECTSTFCAIPQHTVCGTCQAAPAVGASCQIAADCGRDLACATPAGATSGTCAVYAVSGAPCLTGTQPCAAGLACVGDDVMTTTSGSCQATAATVGAMCDAKRKTAANCEASVGLACIPSAAGSALGTCQKITLAAAGMPCGDVGAAPITGVADCASGGQCVKATGAASGTCVAAAADGAACDSDPTLGPPCLAPAKCVPTAGGTAGICTLPDAASCM